MTACQSGHAINRTPSPDEGKDPIAVELGLRVEGREGSGRKDDDKAAQ
jgi:hypothetical protein